MKKLTSPFAIIMLSIVSLLNIIPVAHLIAKTLSSPDYYGVAVNTPLTQFEAIDGLGQSFSSEDFSGRQHIVFFGNTRCGSICYPRIRLFKKINQALELQSSGLKHTLPAIEYNFITIDPDYDQPALMKAYFEKRFSQGRSVIIQQSDQLQKLTASLGAHFSPQAQGQFSHGDYIYLLDDKRQVKLMYGGKQLAPEKIAQDIIKMASPSI